MAKQIKIQPTPDLIAKPVVNFTVEEYNAMVWNKGYDCVVESAVKCPCKTKDNSYLSTCKNCSGTGWVFINPVKDRVLLSSINYPTEYKDWSELNLGTVNITVAKRTPLSFMDKLTVIDSEINHSQVLYPIVFNEYYFAYTIYDIVSIVEIFKFIDEDTELQKLEEGVDFTFDRNKILFTYTVSNNLVAFKAITGYADGGEILLNDVGIYKFIASSTSTPDNVSVILPDDILVADPGRWVKQSDYTVSVRYRHKLQYYIIDVPHGVRNSYRKNKPTGRDELQILPLNAIGRLSHYVLDAPNFEGDNVFDNSYQVI